MNNKLKQNEQNKKMKEYLKQLYYLLTNKYLDFIKIGKIIDCITELDKKKGNSYFDSLLQPEINKGIKIPSVIPIPSCVFQFHNYFTITPNNKGNFAFIFNPFFLGNIEANKFKEEFTIGRLKATTTNFLSTFFLNNSNSLNGISDNDNFTPIDINQLLPNVYEQYRLVSSSVQLKYTGRIDKISGILGASIIYDPIDIIGVNYNVVTSTNPPIRYRRTGITSKLAKYGNFDLAIDSSYHHENPTIDGIRAIYFPLDNAYEEFTKITETEMMQYKVIDNATEFTIQDKDNYKAGFNFFFYGLGTPGEEACFKIDIFSNFECLPNSTFLNYLPISNKVENISSSEKKENIKFVQSNAIKDLKSFIKNANNRNTLLESLII